MAPPNDGPVVKGGYWYCDNKFPTPVASIPSEFFTHLFAAFAKVDPNTYEVTFPEEHREQFSTFTLTVQQRNPNVRTLLSIGGVSSTSTFVSLASDPNARETFIHSSISLARSNDFHGLILHWLYPSTEEEMTNLGSLLNEWRGALVLESQLTGNEKLLLVAAVYYRPTYRTLLYPIRAIATSLDWINLVAYDFYNPALSWNATGPFAALLNGHIQQVTPRSADDGVDAWSRSQVTARNIVLGLPFYGVAWLLEDAARTEIFAPADGPADGQAVGVYIDPSDGTILYNQIRYFIETQPGVNVQHSPEYVLDYCSAGKTWIAYNDTESITTKVTYARNKTLLGYSAWHVGGDRQGILSSEAFEAWDHNALGGAGTGGGGTGGAGTGGAGTGGAGTGGAGTGGAGTRCAGTGGASTGGAGIGGAGTGGAGTGSAGTGGAGTGGAGTGGAGTGGAGTGGAGTGGTGTGGAGTGAAGTGGTGTGGAGTGGASTGGAGTGGASTGGVRVSGADTKLARTSAN